MNKYVLIFFGSGLGGLFRYFISGWAQKFSNGTFPIGTLAVNLLGCASIGFLSVAFSGRILIREEFRLAVIVGFIGGFTTFSAFGNETFAFLNDGQYFRAAANVVLSLVLGLTCVWAGYRIAEHWLGV